MQAAIEAKRLPDIAQIDTGRFTQFQPDHIFVDVSDLIKEFGQAWNGFRLWGPMMAGSVMAAIPVMVLSMLAQKFVVQGLAAGAVKG